MSVGGSVATDVTESPRCIWERQHYCRPSRVVLTTTHSSSLGGASGRPHAFERLPNGSIEIEFVTVRDGRTQGSNSRDGRATLAIRKTEA
jgi:hypothetical protein